MKILVLNAGSSSQKACLYQCQDSLSDCPAQADWEAQIDWRHKEDVAYLTVKTSAGDSHSEKTTFSSKRQALTHLISFLYQGPTQVVTDLKEIDIVGHRIVHGGEKYSSSVVITPVVKAEISRLSALAPNHNPANLEGIELMEQLLGAVPQLAVFDTAFHSTLPDVAAIYPGPYSWVAQGIRRYGFHGISHQYCAYRAAQVLNRPLGELRLIICHLGNGGSLSAVKGGRSIDTTMGFTPLDGLMMGTRSGAVDPGILIHLARQGYSADDLDRVLNKESGLKGISGISHDLREILASKRNERAALAQDIYIHRLKACFGAMLMSLGDVDAVVFTAGIGEHSAWVRAAACEGMAFLGLQLDVAKNENAPVDQDIATADSMVRVLVIRTQENWAIAQECQHYLSEQTS